MSTSILTTENLHKQYGNLHAVNNVSLKVEANSIYGILGPNGSGKSTTLGMVLGIVNPTSGSYSWFGQGSADDNRKKVGALLEKPNFYPFMSGYKNLKLVATIKDLPISEVDRVLDVVGLTAHKDRSFKVYSTGMKQRLGIASTLLGDPEVLVLDEPTNGLDPQGMADVRNLIIRLGESGKTILVSSHILAEIEKVCTHVAVYKQGRLLVQGAVQEVLQGDGNTLFEVALPKDVNAEMFFRQHPDFKGISKSGDVYLLSLNGDVGAEQLNKFCFEKGHVLSHLSLKKKSLEESFLEITAE